MGGDSQGGGEKRGRGREMRIEKNVRQRVNKIICDCPSNELERKCIVKARERMRSRGLDKKLKSVATPPLGRPLCDSLRKIDDGVVGKQVCPSGLAHKTVTDGRECLPIHRNLSGNDRLECTPPVQVNEYYGPDFCSPPPPPSLRPPSPSPLPEASSSLETQA